MRARVFLRYGETLIKTGEVSSKGSYLAVFDPYWHYFRVKTALLGMFLVVPYWPVYTSC